MTNPREPTHTVAFVDAYCAHYRAVFTNVRHFEQFTPLQLGLLAETKRKSLPRLARPPSGSAGAPPLPGQRRLVSGRPARRSADLTRQALRDRSFIHCIDETGDRKKGKTTDDAASQYIGNIHGLSNGVVSVKAYAALNTVTFPLAFRIYKPQRRLKPGDVYQSKPQLAVELIEELLGPGFRFSVVVADSLYGESGTFISALHRLGLQHVVTIRSNHGVWLGPGQRVRQTRWRLVERVFTDGSSEQRCIRETIYGTRGGRALLPDHHRPSDLATRDDLGGDDQPTGQD